MAHTLPSPQLWQAATSLHMPRWPGTLHAWQGPQEPWQQTPSVELPLKQSLSALHFLPAPHFTEQPAPPQSTSVSLPSLIPSLHTSIPPQPSGIIAPQVSIRLAHVFGVHPHTPPL